MAEIQHITLYELNSLVKKALKNSFPENFWIIGEISEMNNNQSGHCYLELIEKSKETDQITARVKATIWAFTFRMLKPYFESVTGQRFTVGLKVLLQVSVEFNEIYGYSLNVKDIQPEFTLGDLTRKRQEIIKKLQDDGVFYLNKELELPIVPQRIAIISSETAAGYSDFVDQLEQNAYAYKYYIKLFNAYMQGENAEKSIIEALEKIFDDIDDFDIVVMIRGGGSQADLDCFNSYWLNYHITQFPKPVITGIGHERDESIADLVAHTSLKTPTAVAEFIIDKTFEFETMVEELTRQIADRVNEEIENMHNVLIDATQRLLAISKLSINNAKQHQLYTTESFRSIIKNKIREKRLKLDAISNNLQRNSNHLLLMQKKLLKNYSEKTKYLIKNDLHNEHKKINEYSGKISLLDPVHILKRGYTLTFCNGLLIKNVNKLKPGDIIESKWHSGSAQSEIMKIKPDLLTDE